MINYGVRGKHQRYFCKDCAFAFVGKKHISETEVWDLYQSGLTHSQIAKKFSVSISTIKRLLLKVKIDYSPPRLNGGVVHIDVTYWGRNQGLLVALDASEKCVLYYQWISHEKGIDYANALDAITSMGYKIKALVLDGGVGLSIGSQQYPVQMCQYHYIAIIRRKLTMNPKIEASKELLKIARGITKQEKEVFVKEFSEWQKRWDLFLKERTIQEEDGQWRYTHRALRSAAFTTQGLIPYLFTHKDYPDLNIPNTNNALEGLFTALKTALRNHNGMSQANKERFVCGFFRHKGYRFEEKEKGE